jgi:hypothetical protein
MYICICIYVYMYLTCIGPFERPGGRYYSGSCVLVGGTLCRSSPICIEVGLNKV